MWCACLNFDRTFLFEKQASLGFLNVIGLQKDIKIILATFKVFYFTITLEINQFEQDLILLYVCTCNKEGINSFRICMIKIYTILINAVKSIIPYTSKLLNL